MKRYLLLWVLCIAFMSVEAKIIYSCFLSQDVNLETSEVTNQVTDNSLVTIIVDGSTLKLGSYKTYTLFNRTTSDFGFTHIIHYDAIDNHDQRCKIKIITDPSQDWTVRNAILIWYNVISPIGKWYQSREPQEK